MFLRHFPSLLLIVVSILPDRGCHAIASGGIPLEEHEGYNVKGATYQSGITTLQSCLDACAAKPECTAVDFNACKNTCWHHTGLCGELNGNRFCTHYRFVICALEQRLLEGERQDQFTGDAAACVAACRSNGTCRAVDHYHTSEACYFHLKFSACRYSQSYKDVTNYALTGCGLGLRP